MDKDLAKKLDRIIALQEQMLTVQEHVLKELHRPAEELKQQKLLNQQKYEKQARHAVRRKAHREAHRAIFKPAVT